MGESARSDTLRDVFRSEPCPASAGGDLCGQRLPGDYQVLELWAETETCFVYRGLQLSLGREVAIELLRPGCCDEPARARFMLASRRAGRFKHPNVVDLLDLGYVSDGRPFVVLELVRGVDLEHLLREHGPLSLERVVDLMVQVLSALAEAHAQGFAHGDLTLERVLVRGLANGQELVKVIDFGRSAAGRPGDVRADLEAAGTMLQALLPRALSDALHLALEYASDALELREALLALLHEAPCLCADELQPEFMGCPSCASCVPIARHCCDCGRPLVLSSLTVPRGRACA
jgi:serine/threonine protein kinase